MANKVKETLEDYRNKSDAELKMSLAQLKRDYCKARLGLPTDSNVNLLNVKKQIARLQTIIRERELGINQEKKA